MYEHEGLFCNTAFSGILAQPPRGKKRNTGQIWTASPIEGKKGALGWPHPVGLAQLKERPGKPFALLGCAGKGRWRRGGPGAGDEVNMGERFKLLLFDLKRRRCRGKQGSDGAGGDGTCSGGVSRSGGAGRTRNSRDPGDGKDEGENRVSSGLGLLVGHGCL